MRPLLAWIIICHWAVLFVLLAAVVALDPARGPLAAFEMLGATVQPSMGELNPLLSAVAAWTVASTALLFVWALLSVAFAQRGLLEDGVVSLAFASGAGLLVLGMLVGLVMPVRGHFGPLALYLLGLLASYLAIAIPVRPAQERAGSEEVRMAVRMASITGARSPNLARTEEFG
ncbi:MAG: hypothetical protein JNL61_17660 [Rhizobiaceae bacterium]|nr:hypothetical protein [Rhizobiaceae bacterium]